MGEALFGKGYAGLIEGTVLKPLKQVEGQGSVMSTDYVPSKNISFSELKTFNHMGVRVDTIDEIDNIILTDGKNYMWVWPPTETEPDETPENNVGSTFNDCYLGMIFTHYAGNSPRRIIEAIEDFFKIRLISENEDEYYDIVASYEGISSC